MTLRALRAVEQAELLIWADSLVSPEIVALAPASCQKLRSGNLTLEQVLEAMVDGVRRGLRVVRLHDGDPCLYGALQEQIARLADAEIAVEVIPGISAYQATAAALNAELTIPGLVQTIVLSRASGRTGTPERESLERLAALGASLCLYLSARHVDEVEQVLLQHYPADTPVAVGYYSQAQGLERTTLYVVSPALGASGVARSKLYSPEHDHLFRPRATPPQTVQP
ncbi:MAG: precorrin-4 C(11)-methyltransferase [Synechococcaceae bacterium WB6_3B_236]|nr:precorrin-4 C(11)-methyltransferase [Synechococcaceae bacterium WB6_3B_236]